MQWIEDYSRATFKAFSGQVIEGFQPLDFFHFYPLWYDLWIGRIVKALDAIDVEHKKYNQIKKILPPPSNLRAILIKLIVSYKGINDSAVRGDYRNVANFLVRMLQEACPDDPFAEHANPCHTEAEINEIYRNNEWRDSETKDAKNIGRLITAAGSLVHGLYNDLVTDYGWEAYGPYRIAEGGNDYSLLVRHFPDLAPSVLWPPNILASVHEILIYSLYQNVEWEIACVGCHTLVKSGDPISGLKKFLIFADGKEISGDDVIKLTDELSHKAEVIYKEIRKMDFEELKLKVLWQECYQLKKLFDAAHLDWRPTEEMVSRVKNKPLLIGVVPHGKLMTDLNEYKELFGINKFFTEVLKEMES